VIFVKLWQFDLDDRTQFRKNMTEELPAPVDGIATTELHRDAREVVTYNQLAPGGTLHNSDPGGLELLVIDGAVSEAGETLSKGSWLRLPEGTPLSAQAGPDGAQLWIKSGHLPHAKPPAV